MELVNLVNMDTNDINIIKFIEEEFEFEKTIEEFRQENNFPKAFELIKTIVTNIADTKGITFDEASVLYEDYQLQIYYENVKELNSQGLL